MARYRLQKKVNAGNWKDVTLSSPATLTADIGLAAGSNRYTFRVRAIDAAGNLSTWKTGPAFGVSTLQEKNAAISYSGTFPRVPMSGSSGGYVRWSGTEGHTATLTFTGRSVALVTARGTRGKLRISVDGQELVNMIDLYDYAPFPKWIPAAYNLAPGTHTMVVEALGTSNGASGNPRIDIDAFIVLN